jgi:hypothetical protein
VQLRATAKRRREEEENALELTSDTCVDKRTNIRTLQLVSREEKRARRGRGREIENVASESATLLAEARSKLPALSLAHLERAIVMTLALVLLRRLDRPALVFGPRVPAPHRLPTACRHASSARWVHH